MVSSLVKFLFAEMSASRRSMARPVLGSWHDTQSPFPPIASVLSAKMWTAPEYQALREKLATPILTPRLTLNKDMGFITVDLHTCFLLHFVGLQGHPCFVGFSTIQET